LITVGTIALVLAVLVAAAVIALRWRNGLHIFEPVGNEVGADQVAVGRTFYAEEVSSPDSGPLSLQVTSIAPVVTVNSAHADVRVLICTLRPGLSTGFLDEWSLQRWCSSVRSFTPGRYMLSPLPPVASSVFAVVAITPRGPGTVHVAGVHLRYEQGIRRGDQQVGIEVNTQTH
jgi:hypothetical protein